MVCFYFIYQGHLFFQKATYARSSIPKLDYQLFWGEPLSGKQLDSFGTNSGSEEARKWKQVFQFGVRASMFWGRVLTSQVSGLHVEKTIPVDAKLKLCLANARVPVVVVEDRLGSSACLAGALPQATKRSTNMTNSANAIGRSGAGSLHLYQGNLLSDGGVMGLTQVGITERMMLHNHEPVVQHRFPVFVSMRVPQSSTPRKSFVVPGFPTRDGQPRNGPPVVLPFAGVCGVFEFAWFSFNLLTSPFRPKGCELLFQQTRCKGGFLAIAASIIELGIQLAGGSLRKRIPWKHYKGRPAQHAQAALKHWNTPIVRLEKDDSGFSSVRHSGGSAVVRAEQRH